MQPGMDGKVSQLSWPAVFHSAFRGDDGGMTSVHAPSCSTTPKRAIPDYPA